MAQLELHPAADTEIDVGIAHYENEWPGLGLEFFDEVEQTFARIQEWPTMWRSYGDIPDLHRVNLQRFPYYVVYRFRNPIVQVIAVGHQQQRPEYWRDRLTHIG